MNRRKLEITEELRDLGFDFTADSLDEENPSASEYRYYSADMQKARRESTEEELPQAVYLRAVELVDEWFSLPNQMMERKTMKITKRQLKRIIREERLKILRENQGHNDLASEVYAAALEKGYSPQEAGELAAEAYNSGQFPQL